MYKGAVFFDYDGTLVDETDNISRPTPDTLEALRSLKKNGYLVALSTGRAKCYIPKIDFDFDCYITANGSCAEINNKIIHNKCIEKNEFPELLSYFEEKDINYVLESHDYCFCRNLQEKYLQDMFNRYSLPKEKFVGMENADFSAVNKMVLTYNDQQKIIDFKNKYGKKYEIIPQYENTKSCDLAIMGVNKASGVKAIIQHLNINIKNTYALGDGANDLEMFQMVNTSIAMGKHSSLLDNFSSHITDTVINNGLSKALRKFELI